jgi:branched-chain amino acid aminotransferase
VAAISLWRITPTVNLKLDTGASTVDEVTRELPEGYYSTFRTFAEGTRVLGLSAHLRRLYDPVTAPEVVESTLRQHLRALLESYRPHEARVRAVMTRQGQAYLAMAPLVPLPPEIYEKGVRVETTKLQREHPRLKSTSFIDRSDLARKHIAQEGIFEALLVKDGKILEGMTSNFFYVVRQDGRSVPPYVGTARDDILLGVTRQTVIEIAVGQSLEVSDTPLALDQIVAIDEAFITSSSRGIVPVVQIDNVTIGQGSPGLVTKQLIAAYEGYVLQNAEEI